MRSMKVRQTKGEASSSSAAAEGEDQPRVSASVPNIFKDSRQEKCTTNRGKKCNICTPMGCFCPDDPGLRERRAAPVSVRLEQGH